MGNVAQRQVALAGVALLAVVGALATAQLVEGSARESQPGSVPAPGGGWYEALAAPYRVDARARRTTCGHRARPTMLGVAHPVLTCGAKIVVRYRDREVLTQVIDRGTGVPGREFDITSALARRLGLSGIKTIRWRFAA